MKETVLYLKEALRLMGLLAGFTLLLYPLYHCSEGSSPVSPNPGSDAAVYPMFVDDNGDGVNDFVAMAGHDAGTIHDGDLAVRQGAAARGHAFRDRNGDGICDHAQDGSNTWHGPGFIDEDGDGTCDWWDEDMPRCRETCGIRFRDRNRNRVNDHFEAQWHEGCGHGFVDTDGDGICDRAQDGSPSWHGPGFVDSDGDGVCDHWGPNGDGNYRHRWEHHYRYRHGSEPDPVAL